jgi:hypothetical protein
MPGTSSTSEVLASISASLAQVGDFRYGKRDPPCGRRVLSDLAADLLVDLGDALPIKVGFGLQ